MPGVAWWQSGTGTITVVGLILGVLGWLEMRRTHQRIAQGEAQTRALMAQMDAGWREAWARMDARAEARDRDL